MYIAPDTIVRVLRNCPLDNTYDHTIYFNSKSAQTSYFAGLTAYTFPKVTYNRLNQGQLKIQQKAENLYNCNYIMYQNTGFGNKWFYAFITSIEYISNDVSLITFEIDVMQTWFFDVTLEQCFVEREHVMDDTIGANIQPEPVDLGEYVYGGFSSSGHCKTPCAVLMNNVGSSGEEIQSTYAANVLHGTAFHPYSVTETGQTAVREALKDITTSWDVMNESIVSVFMYYADFIDNDEITMTRGATYNISKSKNYSNIDGYIPKNNKLFTYPYNYMLVTTDEGDSLSLKYEFFSGSTCGFVMAGSVAANPQISLQPLNYKGCSFLRNEQLILSGFPQCTYNIDSFKAWLSQTASNPSTWTNLFQSAASGASMGGGQGAAIGAATALIGTAIGGGLAAVNPPEVKGTSQSAVNYSQGKKDFYFYTTYITSDYAKRIDNFFDVYGYAVNMHKTPNRSGRPHWNYVKNKTTNLVGNAPADDVNQIVSIYNKGITFWKNGNEVGNYSLDNSI